MDLFVFCAHLAPEGTTMHIPEESSLIWDSASERLPVKPTWFSFQWNSAGL